MVLSESQLKQYHDEGWCMLPAVMSPHDLATLRDECQHFIDLKHKEMDAAGTDTLGISHRHSRYFISRCHLESQGVHDFLFGELMSGICHDLFGDEAYLFFDQYVVKGADGGMKFSWHQDSGYVNKDGDTGHRAYVTCWCPLDDVTEKNGTVYLLPYSRSGIRSWVQHVRDPETNDWVGYFGQDRGITIEAPAGSIVLFSSLLFHASGSNTTPNMRRAFLAQYSPEPIMKLDRSGPWAHAEPVVQAGRQAVLRPT